MAALAHAKRAAAILTRGVIMPGMIGIIMNLGYGITVRNDLLIHTRHYRKCQKINC